MGLATMRNRMIQNAESLRKLQEGLGILKEQKRIRALHDSGETLQPSDVELEELREAMAYQWLKNRFSQPTAVDTELEALRKRLSGDDYMPMPF